MGLGRLNKIMHVKSLAQCLERSKCPEKLAAHLVIMDVLVSREDMAHGAPFISPLPCQDCNSDSSRDT